MELLITLAVCPHRDPLSYMLKAVQSSSSNGRSIPACRGITSPFLPPSLTQPQTATDMADRVREERYG